MTKRRFATNRQSRSPDPQPILAGLSLAKDTVMPTVVDQAPGNLVNVRDFVEWGAAKFTEYGLCFGHGTDNSRDEAAVLVSSVLGLDFDAPQQQLEKALTDEQKRSISDLLVRRIVERKPAPYLTGEAWFAGLKFRVDERVLIPRSPIAEWIERGFAPWIDAHRVGRILDIGTGSGCIAIAAALMFPQAQVVAVDISERALQVTAENISMYGLESRVNALRSDLFAAVCGRFDVIVSNPPYVDGDALAAMPAEFHHEPRGGLSGGCDGLDLVRQILHRAYRHMNENAILIVEVGASALALLEVYPKVPFVWLDLEHGGENVFLLEASALQESILQ